jgi:hypothetical protein
MYLYKPGMQVRVTHLENMDDISFATAGEIYTIVRVNEMGPLMVIVSGEDENGEYAEDCLYVTEIEPVVECKIKRNLPSWF